DLGQTNFSAATCRDVARVHANEGLDLGVLVGDLSYADTNASRWDSFQRMFDTSGCADIPWVVLPGNHDCQGPREIEPDEITGEPFLPFRVRWRTPQVQSEEVAALLASECQQDALGKWPCGSDVDAWQHWATYDLPLRFDFGGSFFGLEARSEFNAGLVVVNPGHAATRSRDEVLTHVATRNLRSAAEPLLLPDKMDLVFSGHVHAYERSFPIDGVQHFVVGHGGNMEALYNSWQPSATSAFRAADHYGWGLLHLRPRRLGPSSFTARRAVDGAVMDFVEFWPRNQSAVVEPATDSGNGNIIGSVLGACLMICLCAGCCFYRRARVRASYEEKSSLRREAVTLGVVS
ncbi:PAP21, partial [Symbiodinium pilosum]